MNGNVMEAAKIHFKQALDNRKTQSGGLVAVMEAGWQEMMPSEHSWHFVHHDYPKVMIDWTPGGEPLAHETWEEADWRSK